MSRYSKRLGGCEDWFGSANKNNEVTFYFCAGFFLIDLGRKKITSQMGHSLAKEPPSLPLLNHNRGEGHWDNFFGF